MKTSTVRSVIYLAGGIGLLVALFSAAEFYTASLRSVCSLNQFFSCATVDKSGKTSTLGIPDWLWGVGGFIALLIVAGLAERWPRDVRWAYLLLLFSTGAVAISGYFIYVQIAEIHALCVVCVTAEGFATIVWIASIALAARTRRKALSGVGPPDRPAPADAPPSA